MHSMMKEVLLGEGMQDKMNLEALQYAIRGLNPDEKLDYIVENIQDITADVKFK